jgi:hypothetical protein
VPINRARPLPASGNTGKEVGLLEIGVEFAIKRRAGGLDIRDVKKVAIGAARISRTHCLAYDRVHAVAPGDVGRLACLFLSVSTTQTRDDMAAGIAVAEELGLPFDRNAKPLQPRDQQPLMLVLRKDLKKGIRGQLRGDFLEVDARPWLAFDPEPNGRDFVSVFDDEIGEVELAIEFERTRVHRQRTGGRAGHGGLVDDAEIHAELGQPQREGQTGRPGADDQYVASGHIFLHQKPMRTPKMHRAPSGASAPAWSSSVREMGRATRGRLLFDSSSRSSFLFAHDLSQKTGTHPGSSPGQAFSGSCARAADRIERRKKSTRAAERGSGGTSLRPSANVCFQAAACCAKDMDGRHKAGHAL